jgi:hypothetical protein
MSSDLLMDNLADALVPKLIDRGFVKSSPVPSSLTSTVEYDADTCRQFLDAKHIGTNVLERAEVFFRALKADGEINSLDLVDALELEGGPRTIPANLTIALKKSYRRLGLSKPWAADTTGERTVWRDRDGIAARMVDAIQEERARRGI